MPSSGGGAAKGKPLTHMHDSQTEGHKDSVLNDAGVMKLQPGDAFFCVESLKNYSWFFKSQFYFFVCFLLSFLWQQ